MNYSGWHYAALNLLYSNMKIIEVIHRIQNLYAKGNPPNGSRLSRRQVYNKLVSVRSRLLTQELNKRRKISSWILDTLPCVELVESSPSECECVPKDIGCKLLRSKHKLPKPVVTYTKHYIESVKSVDGSIVYSEKDDRSIKYTKAKKYGADKPCYYFSNGYLYTTHFFGPRVLTVKGIFEDDVEVESFNSMSCLSSESSKKNDSIGKCKPFYENEFKLEDDLIDQVIELSFRELVDIFSQVKPERVVENITESQ